MMGPVSTTWTLVRETVTHNFRLKVFALLFSLVLFAYFHGQGDNHQRTLPFDVIARLPPDSAKRALVTALPSAIRVTLKGPVSTVDRLSQNSNPLEIDLRNGTRSSITFDESLLGLPPDVTVLLIDPPSIDLEWQPVVEREVPLQASITGQPAEGFVVKGEPQISPSKLIATGPSGDVEVLQFANLEPFNVTGLGEGVYRRRIKLDSAPERVKFRGLLAPSGDNASVANVTVTIARRMSEIRFANRPVSVVGVPAGYSNPAYVDVIVTGPPEVVHALRAEQVVPRADVGALPGFVLKENKRGSRAVRLSVDLAKVEVEVQPPTATIRW
ncbi:MAG: CdaR family protein [Polyangiaceae bacterium]|nr:CdaR family protein [Polyangiaceae bacterium]